MVITPAKRSRKSVEKKESKLARESSDDSSNQVGIPKSETDSNKADDSITTELIATKSKDQSENEKEFSIEKVDEQPQLATKTVEDKVEETPATSESTEKSDSQSKSEQKEVEPLVVSSNDDAKSAEEISNENSAVVSEPENEEAASTEKEKVPLIDTVTHVEEAAKSDVQPITDKSEEETNSSEVERVVILNKGDEKSSADEESSAEPKIDESAPEIAQSNGNDAETVSSGEISTQ